MPITEDTKVPLSRAIMAPRDIIRNTREAQRLALFFDFIMVWPLDRSPVEQEDAERLRAELEYLASEKVVVRCGFKVPPLISFMNEDGSSWDPFSFASDNCEVVLPFQAVTNIPQHPDTETNADRTVRHVSGLLQYADAPVTAHVEPANVRSSSSGAQALELTLKQIPLPPEGIPWEDLIQFRSDEETRTYLRKLRLWLQQRALSGAPVRHIDDELMTLLDDYRRYMRIQHKKFGEGILSTVLLASADAAANLLNFKVGDALKSLVDIRGRKIALNESELRAPGREVAYVAKAQDAFGTESA